jgi:hypothetical protein
MSRSRARFSGLCAALTAFTALAASAGTSLRAQEYEVSRRIYNFYDDRLDIEVLANSAGQLQILHGDGGRVEVAAHASSGIAASALATERGSVLRLTALGAKSAEYVVIVPEQADVRVKLPGRSGWTDAARYASSKFRWDSIPEPLELDYTYPKPTLEGRYFVVSSRSTPPARLRLFHPEHIRSVEVRIEGTEFMLASTEPLTNSPGVRELLDIDPGLSDVDLVIQVPSFTRSFELVAGDQTILRMDNGAVTSACGGGIRQQTPRGQERFKYLPQAGLDCRAAR